MRSVGDFLVVMAALALIPWPFCYHLTTRGHWRDSLMGWHLMSFMAVLGVVMVYVLFSLAYDLPPWVRPLIWLLVAAVAWWRLILLFVVQMRDERTE